MISATMLTLLGTLTLLVVLLSQVNYFKECGCVRKKKKPGSFWTGWGWGGGVCEFNCEASHISTFPTIPRIPLIETAIRFILYGFRFSKIYKYFGTINSVVSFRLFDIKLVLINDFDLCKEAFLNPKFSGKITTDVWTFYSQGQYGIMNTHGKSWEEQRKFCVRQLKTFGFGTKTMEPFIQAEIDDFLQILKRSQGQPITPNKMFYVPILNSLWKIIAGERFSKDDAYIYNMIMEAFDSLSRALKFPEFLIVFSTLSQMTLTWICVGLAPLFPGIIIFYLRIFKLRSYFKELIQSRLKSLHLSDTPRDLLDAYLQEIQNCKDPESGFYGNSGELNLMSIISEFFLAGADTTANILPWSLLHLIRNPDIQRQIQIEIDSVVGHNRTPQLFDRPFCPYTEAFLEELLRVNPVSINSLPHETLEDVTLGPYFLPKGTTVLLNIISINHNPDIWGDPETFRPSRFLSPDGKTFLKNEKMISFSVGKRRCPGEQLARDNLFLFVSSICQRFTLNQDPRLKDRKPPLDEVRTAIYTPRKFYMIAQEREQYRELDLSDHNSSLSVKVLTVNKIKHPADADADDSNSNASNNEINNNIIDFCEFSSSSVKT